MLLLLALQRANSLQEVLLSTLRACGRGPWTFSITPSTTRISPPLVVLRMGDSKFFRLEMLRSTDTLFPLKGFCFLGVTLRTLHIRREDRVRSRPNASQFFPNGARDDDQWEG